MYRTNHNGIIPIIIIVAIVVLIALIVCLYLWPFYTIGTLLVLAAGWLFLTGFDPRIAAGVGIAGIVLIVLAGLGVI